MQTQHTKPPTKQQKPRTIGLSGPSQIKTKISHFTYGGVCTFFQMIVGRRVVLRPWNPENSKFNFFSDPSQVPDILYIFLNYRNRLFGHVPY